MKNYIQKALFLGCLLLPGCKTLEPTEREVRESQIQVLQQQEENLRRERDYAYGARAAALAAEIRSIQQRIMDLRLNRSTVPQTPTYIPYPYPVPVPAAAPAPTRVRENRPVYDDVPPVARIYRNDPPAIARELYRRPVGVDAPRPISRGAQQAPAAPSPEQRTVVVEEQKIKVEQENKMHMATATAVPPLAAASSGSQSTANVLPLPSNDQGAPEVHKKQHAEEEKMKAAQASTLATAASQPPAEAPPSYDQVMADDAQKKKRAGEAEKLKHSAASTASSADLPPPSYAQAVAASN